MVLPKLSLVLGGARSGKSAFAERLVLGSGARPVYLATAQAFDDEMQDRITAHKKLREGQGWVTVEETVAIADEVLQRATDEVVLLDCATLWLSNVILAEHDVAQATARLLDALRQCAARVVVVSNEVGLGIVPDNALARRFRDAQGSLNQAIAAEAGLVVAVMAGLPLALKGELP